MHQNKHLKIAIEINKYLKNANMFLSFIFLSFFQMFMKRNPLETLPLETVVFIKMRGIFNEITQIKKHILVRIF